MGVETLPPIKNKKVGKKMVEIGKGKHQYLVTLMCGGETGNPEIYYSNYQIVNADTEEQAREIYDKTNNCFYYYGSVIRQIK